MASTAEGEEGVELHQQAASVVEQQNLNAASRSSVCRLAHDILPAPRSHTVSAGAGVSDVSHLQSHDLR